MCQQLSFKLMTKYVFQVYTVKTSGTPEIIKSVVLVYMKIVLFFFYLAVKYKGIFSN